MKKTVFLISTIILGSLFLQACETLRGTEKDIMNTGDNLSQGVNAVLEADRKFEEKYW